MKLRSTVLFLLFPAIIVLARAAEHEDKNRDGAAAIIRDLVGDEDETINHHQLRGNNNAAVVLASPFSIAEGEGGEEGNERDTSDPSSLAQHRELLPALSYPMNGFRFDCNVQEATQTPFQDCINLIGAFCSYNSPVFQSECDCTKKVLAVRNNVEAQWKYWINSCAVFAGGSPTSKECVDNTTYMYENGRYAIPDGTTKVPNPRVGKDGFVSGTRVPVRDTPIIEAAKGMWNFKNC